MRLFLFLFVILPLFLRGHWDQFFSEDEDPSVFHHVNVITGNLNLCFQDAIVEAVEPLPLLRTYTSAGALERSEKNTDLFFGAMRGGWLIQGGWNLLPHANLFIEPSIDKKQFKAYLPEKTGNLVVYTFSHKRDKHFIFLKPSSNTFQTAGRLSGATNTKNNLLRLNLKTGEAILFLPDGGQRIYTGPSLDTKNKKKPEACYYILKTEILPNQRHIRYSYDGKKRLTDVTLTNPKETKNYASLHFDLHRTKTPFYFQATTSDGKQLSYRSIEYKDRSYLSSVQSNSRPQESSTYSSARKGIGARMETFSFDDKMQFRVHYYLPPDRKAEEKWAEKPKKKPFNIDKVRLLEAPFGPKGAMIPLAEFFYHQKYTDVYDADHLLTRYHHDSKRLLDIEYYDRHSHLVSTIKFVWNGDFLSYKILIDSKGNKLLAKHFKYDSRGNVLEEEIQGNIRANFSQSDRFKTTGNKEGLFQSEGFYDSYKKTYTYHPSLNLLVSEQQDCGPRYTYEYKLGTNLLTSKLTYADTKIAIREFFFYNEDNILREEIIDNGSKVHPSDLTNVTERRIKRYDLDPATGLVATFRELYLDTHSGAEKLLKKIEYKYIKNQIVSEAVYDASDTYRYTLHTTYDTQGRVTSKTNPLSQKNTYSYDNLGNISEVKEVGSLKKIYTHDTAGRPTTCTEVDETGETRTSYTTYDAKGRLVSQTDFRGNTTIQSYDDFGKCIQTQFPEAKDENGQRYIPTVQFTYDSQGNLVSTITSKGESSKTSYNIFKNPTQIVQPDGSRTLNSYNPDGTLQKMHYPDGTEETHYYDNLKRLIEKNIAFCSLEKLSNLWEKWQYSAFHLVSHTDLNRLTTHYFYDGAGRKIAEEAEGRKKQFVYDALGFLERVTEGDITHVEIHDEGGRIKEQWDEDSTGCIENYMQFEYDQENRKKKAVRLTSPSAPKREAVDLFTYDGQRRLTTHTDPDNCVTQIIYDDAFKNDLGHTVTQKTTLDPLKNATIETFDASNRLLSLEKQDPEGKTVSYETFSYDRAGNQAKREITIYRESQPQTTYTLAWEYDALGRIIKQIEADQRVTLYTYDGRGNLKTKKPPNQIELTYTYDGVGRLSRLQSSDREIDYWYIYNLFEYHEPDVFYDRVRRTAVERSYDPFGQPISENNNDDWSLSWDYDWAGRCKKIRLPDNSEILYTYKGAHLTSVKRHTPSFQYQHLYTDFDPNGHIIQEEPIYPLGPIQTTWDLLERPQTQTSPWLDQQVTYGPSGLVMETQNTLLGDQTYAYDALNQLIQEGESYHQFDSLGNPLDCSVDAYNQITHTPDSEIVYDENGNPIKRLFLDHTKTYTYDALGRLTSITDPKRRRVEYTYDPLSRLYAKETYTLQSGEWHKEETLFYLYDRDQEIGILNEKKEIIQLKVLGQSIRGDLTTPVAIELGEQTFAPLVDLKNNLIALISPKGEIVESYQIDAFGREQTATPPLNPWRFCTKRSEEGLIFFENRFYDPSLKRFLSPDPAGFADSLNRYIYVRNSPLNRLDLFGLFSEAIFNGDISIEMPIATLYASPSAQQMIFCKGFIGEASVDWVVSCGFWQKIQFTPEEQKNGKVNIVDHLYELVPKEGMIIGLITAQNGINTNRREFSLTNTSIANKVPEGTLFIGLYNPSDGVHSDISRVGKERNFVDTPIVSQTRQFFVAIATQLHKLNPLLLWEHISHSEAGLISSRAIQGMTDDQKALLKQHLFSYALGPAEPVSRKDVFDAINIYSEGDYITKRYAGPFIDDPNYSIQFIPCISSWREKSLYFADHAIMGKTYQGALGDHCDEQRGKYGFYNGKMR